MPVYRAYPIGDDGHVLQPTIIDAEGDREAVTQAKMMLNGKPIEIWDRSRLVARLEQSSQKIANEICAQGIR